MSGLGDVLVALLAGLVGAVGIGCVLLPFTDSARSPGWANVIAVAVGAALIAVAYGVWLIR